MERRFERPRLAALTPPPSRAPAPRWLQAFRAALAATPNRDPAPRFARPSR